MSVGATSVSTHILDTSVGRPAAGVAVELSVRTGGTGDGDAGGWTAHAASATDADGRVRDLPALPAGTTHVRLVFATGPYLSEPAAEDRQDAPAHRDGGAFFPEVAVVFAVASGEHHHVPLLLTPFGYSVYRGS
ncbi:hydroxyisourate hydrolase [Streptomyces sp. NBC_01808]|uniref:hydroxyisourate hydrolase n=1 Tax=Streptomyces sp. NBC_01808 TaxID=2975947 RepID=UPI002DD9F479|nr:hydroxyisourate hydrolase [Streptomyces sp. NBC_01808]WSA41383.1 hydroxyisourate hydrolase [Streptomyces sp. NBC_01808]